MKWEEYVTKVDRCCAMRKRLGEGGKSTLHHCCRVKKSNKMNTEMQGENRNKWRGLDTRG